MSPKTVQVTWRDCLLAVENAAVRVCCFVLRGRVVVFGSMSPQGDIDIFLLVTLIKYILVAGLPKLPPPPPPFRCCAYQATITPAEQQRAVVGALLDFINRKVV